MTKAALVFAGLSAPAVLVLQGCGGGGGGGGTTTTITTTPGTTTTLSRGPDGLPYCREVSTYYKRTFPQGAGPDGNAAGQCLPTVSPGAYYTHPGDKEGKDDKGWQCWTEHTAHHDRNDAKAQKAGYAGACIFEDHGHSVNPGDVPYCSTVHPGHVAACAPGPQAFWGACYSKQTDNWLCINLGDDNIPSYSSGDCLANVPIKPGAGATPEPFFFDGPCRFEPDTEVAYKCDTIPSYDPELAGTCGQEVSPQMDKACFAIGDDKVWSCLDADSDFPAPCDWQVQSDGTFYKSACYFPQSDKYDGAKDWPNPPVPAPAPSDEVIA